MKAYTQICSFPFHCKSSLAALWHCLVPVGQIEGHLFEIYQDSTRGQSELRRSVPRPNMTKINCTTMLTEKKSLMVKKVFFNSFKSLSNFLGGQIKTA